MLKLIAGLLLTMASGSLLAQEAQSPQEPLEQPATDQPATDQPQAEQAPPAEEAPVERAVAVDDEFDNRWYIEPALGGIFSDASDFDAGPLVSLSIGKPIFNHLAFSFEGTGSRLKVRDLSDSESYKRFTFGANALYYPWRGGWEPFAQLGAYAHKIKFIETDLPVGFGLGAGLGVAKDISPRIALTLGARYNLDFIKGDRNHVRGTLVTIPDDTFYVWTAMVGLRFKLGTWPLDSDGDGVPDRLDKCPNTPRGVQVDKDGCPLDSDGDGVPDYLDKCPGTPRGVLVDKDGCPLDSDGDGVPDRLDKCPGTPPGVAVDRDGCPLDSDHDGVPDYLDKCPNTLKGLQVDNTGCPIKEQVLALDGVHFEFDKDRLTPDSRTILDHVAEALKESPGLSYEIAGHTCNLGSAKYNQSLSTKRAQSVRAYLVQKGIAENQITAKGYGLTQPRVPNDSEAHRELNRRVELRILN